MKAETQRRLARLVIMTAAAVAVLAGLFFLFVRFGVGFVCVFNKFTNLKCPGCGNTHVADALFHFRFREAFRFNYLFPVEFFYIAWVYVVSSASYLKNGHFNYTPPFRPLDITVLAALVIWVVIRNIFHI